MSFNLLPEKFHIQWHITNYCNLRCRHCYQESFDQEEDSDLSSFLQIAHNLIITLRAHQQVACLNITGGEPLLKPELWPLLEYLAQQPEVSELGLITNGLFLNAETVAKISSIPKLKQIKVSLDGPDPQTNDSLRGPGVFLKVVKNLSLLPKAQSWQVFLMFTIMKRNFQTLPALIKLAQELNVAGIILERFIPWGQGREIMAEVLDKKQWWKFLLMLSSLMDISDPRTLAPYQAFQINFLDGEPTLLGAPCVLGIDGFCIMPEGVVYPCRRFPVAIGQLRYESLKHIWQNSSLMAELRCKDNLQGKCRICPLKDCRGCRSLALALIGDYFAADPHCPYTFPSLPFKSSP